jgi:ubiquinone/menaquinone biosynthesis C-methylase UbiE
MRVRDSEYWVKGTKKLYYEKFMVDIYNGDFVVSDKTFSNSKILDCLESETASVVYEAKLVKKVISDKKIKSVLIIGSGSGRLATEILNTFPNIKLFEIDKNPAVIKRLKNKFKDYPYRQPILSTASDLPFKDNSIDLVLCYSVFRYIKNIKGTIAELIRVTDKKGFVLISEAKDEITFKKITKEIIKQKIMFKTNTKSKVKLPRLTFFYYLIDKYSKNEYIKKIIDKEKIKKNIGLEQAAFNIAGYSLDNIYTVICNKSND